MMGLKSLHDGKAEAVKNYLESEKKLYRRMRFWTDKEQSAKSKRRKLFCQKQYAKFENLLCDLASDVGDWEQEIRNFHGAMDSGRFY